MVCMLDTYLHRQGCREMVDLAFATKESAFIEAFGPRLNTVVSEEFENRNIAGHLEYVVKEVGTKCVVFQNGTELDYDLLVSFPPYAAACQFSGAADRRPRLRECRSLARRGRGLERVFTVGDAADFPIKQAFLRCCRGMPRATTSRPTARARPPKSTSCR